MMNEQDANGSRPIRARDIENLYGKMAQNLAYLRKVTHPLLRKLKRDPRPLSSPYYLSMFTYHAVVYAEEYYNFPAYGLHPQRLGEEVGMLLYHHFLDELKETKCQSSTS